MEELSINIINELNQGKLNNYLKHKKETIREFRNYLLGSYPKKEFRDIFSLMLSTEENEIVHNKEYISELCVIYNLSTMYELANDNLKFKLVRIIIYCINKSNGKDMFDYVNKIFNCLSKNPNLLNRVVDILFNYDRLKEILFYQYVKEHFKTIEDASSLMKEVDFWNDNSPKVVSDTYYADKALNKTEAIIRLSNYEDPEVRKLRENFNTIFLGDVYKNRMTKIYKSSEDALLKSINLDYVTAEEIKDIAENIKYTDGSKIRIIKYSNYALNAFKGTSLEKIFREFYLAEKSELFFVKKILRRLLQDTIKSENYGVVVFSHTDSDELCMYDKVIEYIAAYDKNTLYDFIKWTFSSGVFKNKRTMKTDKYYIKALKDYILKEDLDLIKNRKALKKYFSHEELKKLVEDIKFEMAGPVKKALFFRAG